MSLASRISALATRVAAELKSHKALIDGKASLSGANVWTNTNQFAELRSVTGGQYSEDRQRVLSQAYLSNLAVLPLCRVATTANITLSGLQVIDGITLVEDNRVLVKDQSNPYMNAVWIAKSDAWVRAHDFSGDRFGYEVFMSLIPVVAGTENKGIWMPTTVPTAQLGTGPLFFEKMKPLGEPGPPGPPGQDGADPHPIVVAEEGTVSPGGLVDDTLLFEWGA